VRSGNRAPDFSAEHNLAGAARVYLARLPEAHTRARCENRPDAELPPRTAKLPAARCAIVLRGTLLLSDRARGQAFSSSGMDVPGPADAVRDRQGTKLLPRTRISDGVRSRKRLGRTVAGRNQARLGQLGARGCVDGAAG